MPKFFFINYRKPDNSKLRNLAAFLCMRLVQAIVFPVVMYGCESWTIKLSTKELMLLNCGAGEDS